MAIERATTAVVDKPWGSTDLRPWNSTRHDGAAIGEVWFERAGEPALPPALRLKLLFTTMPLSIQVHPDDAFARSLGLPHGKTEAWYILSATPDAQIALGLKRPLTGPELADAIADGSIADLVQWHPVRKNDVILVPAGTIHAIGAGLVLAEIQQRSDATFRLFDYGRDRALHVDQAVAAMRADPSAGQVLPNQLTGNRALLVADSHFVLERIDLASWSTWEIKVDRETWLLMLDGHACIGAMDVTIGESVFLEADSARIRVGVTGAKVLLAYASSKPDLELLRPVDGPPSRLTSLPERQPSWAEALKPGTVRQ